MIAGDEHTGTGPRIQHMSETQSHWEKIYATRDPSAVSWYQPHLNISLQLIGRAGILPTDGIIDVGGGSSTLVDDLLDRGFRNLSVLDISSRAIVISRRRLGPRADLVHWIRDDALNAPLPVGDYRLWHDRAVFHFLTHPTSRRAYIEQVRRALMPGGFALIATFSLEGPTTCSGLQVCRYSAETLAGEFGNDFRIVESRPEDHMTPSSIKQAFVYCLLAFEEKRSR